MNKTVAVVVTYNRRDILKKNIESLLAQKEAQCDILIIDNASADGTSEMIAQDYNIEQLIYCNTGANLGGAGGFEYGVGKAAELGYEYIWIMDDDTWPSDTALIELIKADEKLNGEWGFLSSTVLWTDGKLCKANKPKKTLFSFIKERDMQADKVKVVMSSFVSMFVKVSTVNEVGLPIGDYFIWTDDYEFSGRISRRYPCYYIPASVVTHAMKSNVKANIATDDISRMDRYRYLYRNDVHCYRQFGISGYIYILLKRCVAIALIFFKATGNKKARLETVRKGYYLGKTYMPVIKRNI